MKKVIILGIVLSILVSSLTACNNVVTLESMKKALGSAGYTINEIYAEIYEPNDNSINSIGGFSFAFAGAHRNVNTPVLEFKDNVSAESYAKIVNSNGDFLAVVNDTFLTILEAHHRTAHESEILFLERLISGKSIK